MRERIAKFSDSPGGGHVGLSRRLSRRSSHIAAMVLVASLGGSQSTANVLYQAARELPMGRSAWTSCIVGFQSARLRYLASSHLPRFALWHSTEQGALAVIRTHSLLVSPPPRSMPLREFVQLARDACSQSEAYAA